MNATRGATNGMYDVRLDAGFEIAHPNRVDRVFGPVAGDYKLPIPVFEQFNPTAIGRSDGENSRRLGAPIENDWDSMSSPDWVAIKRST